MIPYSQVLSETIASEVGMSIVIRFEMVDRVIGYHIQIGGHRYGFHIKGGYAGSCAMKHYKDVSLKAPYSRGATSDLVIGTNGC